MNNYNEPLNSRQEIKIAWINLADNYKSIGENELAFELLKTLAYLSGDELTLEAFRELYLEKRLEWEFFNQWTTYRSVSGFAKSYSN